MFFKGKVCWPLERKRRFLQNIACRASVAALFYLTVRFLLKWLAPFLIALALAAGCEKYISFLQRALHLKRGFLAAVLTLLLLALSGTVLGGFFAALLREASSLIKALPQYLSQLPALSEQLLGRLDSFCSACGEEVQHYAQQLLGTVNITLEGVLDGAVEKGLHLITALAASVPQTALFLFTTVLATFFSLARFPQIAAFLRRQLTDRQQQTLCRIRSSVLTSAGQWLRAQLLLLGITFAELLTGLALLRVPYALLLAAAIALVDALPVFGSGIVLLPWALVCFCIGSIPRGFALCAIYAVVTLVHNIAAPKLLSAQSGLPPLASLLAMYAGFCIGGFGGMIFLPLLALLAKQLQQSGTVRLWK